MWTIESLRSANADQSPVLDSILGVGGQDEDMLLAFAEKLEELGSPHVACSAKLPFALSIPANSQFTLPAGRDNCEATIVLSHFRATVRSDRTIGYAECTPDFGAANQGVGTQVSMFMPLWGRHRRYHRNYCSCVSQQGLLNQQLNAALFGRTRAPAGYDGESMSAHRYESETTRAILIECHRAIEVFLRNYNIVAFEFLRAPDRESLPGFFVMIAPGRLTYTKRPISPLIGMVPIQKLPRPIPRERISSAMHYSHREFDRYLSQLLAMQALARSGEFGLALIGCVTAIEWFLNFLHHSPGERTISIRSIRRRDLRIAISDSLWNRLVSIAALRNSWAHGPPPLRGQVNGDNDTEQLNTVIAAGIDVYREAQTQLKLGLLE